MWHVHVHAGVPDLDTALLVLLFCACTLKVHAAPVHEHVHMLRFYNNANTAVYNFIRILR